MERTLKTSQLAVYDDVFSEDEFEAVCYFMKVASYEWVHAKKWVKIWRLLDGAPLHGSQVYSHAIDPADPVYPTGTGIDLVIDAVLDRSRDVEDLIGRHEKDWIAFTARPYAYPQGAGLSWHADPEPFYTGAFVFYAHEAWNAAWGGELLVIDEDCHVDYPDESQMSDVEKRSARGFRIGQRVDNSFLSRALLHRGFGRFIMPKPNRLIFIAGGNYHAINKVDPSAGDHPRFTVSGFFVNAKSSDPP